jgi:hypothetical protein
MASNPFYEEQYNPRYPDEGSSRYNTALIIAPIGELAIQAKYLKDAEYRIAARHSPPGSLPADVAVEQNSAVAWRKTKILTELEGRADELRDSGRPGELAAVSIVKYFLITDVNNPALREDAEDWALKLVELGTRADRNYLIMKNGLL